MANFTDENTINTTLIVPSKVFTDPIDYKLLPNNSPAELLQPLTLRDRFYADMIKDMGVPYPGGGGGGLTPSEMQQIIIFAFNFDVGLSGLSPNAYKTTRLSARYKEAIDTKGITTYRNILKTSTLAIAGYSNAVYQVYESGLGVDKVCSRITGCQSVDTAAAHLDTAGKGSANVTSYLNMNIDSETFKSFGFPDGLSVETTWTHDTATRCKIKIMGLNSGSPIDLVPNRGIELQPFTLGNAQKNQLLSQLLSAYTNGGGYTYNGANGDTFTIPNEDIPSFMAKILLVKEYGDVLQILEYLAIIRYLESSIAVDDPQKLQKSQKIRSMFNMQTTDSVVFELCVALGLSCTYTGSREEVTSGGITVVIYESAPVAPGTNEKNRIDSMYEGFKSQLNAVKFGVNTGIAVLSSLSYQIPDGWVAPGKRVGRSAYSPGNTNGDRTVTDIANNFYSDRRILYETRMMTSTESTVLKMNALRMLSDAIQRTLVTLATTYNAIIGGKSSLGPLNDDEFNINAAETALQTNAIIKFTIGTTEINAPYNEPPLVKVKGQGWVIRNDGMRAKFAEYSGYVGPSMAPPYIVVQGGKKGVRKPVQSKKKPVQSKKKPVHSKKKPVQYGGAGDSVELGLEECIYLKAAIARTRNDADVDDMITLNYNEIVSQSISEPTLYPRLLLRFGGYQDVDGAGNPAVDDAGNPVVSMDEETSDTILREMNDFAEQKLHIADTDHNKELKKLMKDYLEGIRTLTTTDWTKKRALIRRTSKPIPPQITSLTVPCKKDVTMISFMKFNEKPCVHIDTLLTDTYNYLTFMLDKLNFNQRFVFVPQGDPDDPATSWTQGLIVNDNGDGTFIVVYSNGVPGQFPASHIKLAKFDTTDLPIGAFVFVTSGNPDDPATSWTPGLIVNDNGDGTFIVNNSNGVPGQFPASHIKLAKFDTTDLPIGAFVFVTSGDPDNPATSWTQGLIVNDNGDGTFIVVYSNDARGQFPASHIKLAKFDTTDLPIRAFVFVTSGNPDDPATSWTPGQIVEYNPDGTFIVNNSNGVPGQFPASHIKLAKFDTTDLPIGAFVFVTLGEPDDPATSWTQGLIVNDNGDGTFIVNNSNGVPGQFPASHIKLLINSVIDEINSVIDDFKHFWVNIGTIEFPKWFKVTDPQIMIGLNELFSLWNEGKSFFIKGGTKKTKRTKKRRNQKKHTKKMKFRKAPKSKKHRKTKRKGK